MQLSYLKRWHWMIVAVVIGLAIGGVRQGTADEDRIDQYEHLITDPQQFEDAVIAQAYGHHLFENIVVYPYHLAGRGSESRRVVHLVTGQYWNGEPKMVNGQPEAHFVTACFIAAAPYEPPTTLIPKRHGPAFNTVGDYLDFLQGSAGSIQYQYAWWWWMISPLALWTAASLVLIGGIWPTFVNLLAYGTLTHPAKDAGLSLKNVKSSVPVPEPTPHSREIDPALLHELEEAIQAKANSSELVAAALETTTIPRPLTTEPVKVAEAAEDAHAKEFGAKRDDYYPTERRTHHDH